MMASKTKTTISLHERSSQRIKQKQKQKSPPLWED